MNNSKKIKVFVSRIILIAIMIATQSPPFVFVLDPSNAFAASQKPVRVESANTPEVQARLLTRKTFNPVVISTAVLLSSETDQTTNLGPNLISNPSFESVDSRGNPTDWFKGGYGSNTRVLSYPVPGFTSDKAASVTITNYVSGDAKWYFKDVSVTPGVEYQFSNYSLSDVPSIIVVRYKLNDGSFKYVDVYHVNPSTTYQNTTFKITIPQNVVSLTVFHLINKNGSLTVDAYSLNQVNRVSPPPSQNNLVPNGDFEIVDSNNLPSGWKKGGWGTNTRSFPYPVAGVGGTKAAQVEISNYSSGDAKWYFSPVKLSSGVYTYSNQYTANIPSIVTAQFHNNDGSYSYRDLLRLPVSNVFVPVTADFTVGTNVQDVTVFHLIKSVGSLTIDNVRINPKSSLTGIFTTGAVSLRFDDGWFSQYQNALPKLESYGFKGTFYIVTKQLADDGFPAFMSKDQIRDIFAQGHEIGAHTRSHPFLSRLSTADQQNEIAGSRQDLLGMNIGPILSFAYPYGDYSSTTIQIVQDAGFGSAASTIDGYVTPTSDKYQLQRFGPLVNKPLAEIKRWIDDAYANKQWLIMTFHSIDDSGTEFSMSPDTFNQVVDYLAAKKIPVVTISQGMQSVQ